jgi:hypothetical protein
VSIIVPVTVAVTVPIAERRSVQLSAISAAELRYQRCSSAAKQEVGESLKNVHVGDVYIGHGERSTASAIGGRAAVWKRPCHQVSSWLPPAAGEGLTSFNDPREKCAVKKSSYTEQHIALMAPAG